VGRYLFLIVPTLILLATAVSHSAELPTAGVVVDSSFIQFTPSGPDAAVLVRIPFTEMRFRIQPHQGLKSPLSMYTDVQIPLSYHFSNKIMMHLTGSMERMYLMQSQTALLSHQGWGVPLGTMYGSVQTQQAVLEFGIRFGF
jgi:hypothetical protein